MIISYLDKLETSMAIKLYYAVYSGWHGSVT